MANGKLEFIIGTPSDFERVCAFYDIVIAANTGTKYDVLWRRDLHPSDESIRNALEAREQALALKDGKVVATAMVNHDFAHGYDLQPWAIEASDDEALCIHLLATHPEMFGQGLGKALLRFIIEHARTTGSRALRLDVFDHNLPAKKLYEAAGFDLVSTTHLTYDDQAVSDILFAMYEYVL